MMGQHRRAVPREARRHKTRSHLGWEPQCHMGDSGVDKKFKALLAPHPGAVHCTAERGTARRALVRGAAEVPGRTAEGWRTALVHTEGERHLCGTHVASEPPRHGVSVGEHVCLLARAGAMGGGRARAGDAARSA